MEARHSSPVVYNKRGPLKLQLLQVSSRESFVCVEKRLLSAKPALGLGRALLDLLVELVDALESLGFGVLCVGLDVGLGAASLLVGLGDSSVNLCAGLSAEVGAVALSVGRSPGNVRLDIGGNLVHVTLELVLGSLCVAARGVEVVPDTTGGTKAEGERDSRLGHVVVVVGGEEDGCSIDWCVGEEL